MKNAAMNISCTSLVWIYDFNALRYIPRSGLAWSYGNSMFSIFENLPSGFPKWLHHFYVPISNIWGFQILHIFAIQTVLDLWWFNLLFSNFTMVGKQYTFSRNSTSNFDLFPGQWNAVQSSVVMLSCSLKLQLPVNNVITRADEW